MLRKYYPTIETLIGFALLILVNRLFFPESAAYYSFQPHPYWIVILLIACRYGTLSGLLAGGIGGVCFVFLASSSGVIDFSGSTFPHDAYKMPFLFILVGGVLGEIRNLYKKRLAKLKEKHTETVNDLQDLGLQYAALTESKHELDKRIAFQSTTLLNLFDRLNNLEILNPEDIYAKIPDLLKDFLNVQCSSIYLIKDNKFRRYIRRGNKSESGLPKSLDLTNGMMGEVIRSKRVVTINQSYTDDDLSRHNNLDLIMSAPILRKDESIIGVINVEKIPFFDFHSNTVRVFEMLCYWVSVVVDKALQFQQLKDKNIADEITGAYNYLYFQKRLAYEIGRAKRFKTSLSLLLLQVESFEEMNEAETKNVLVVLNWLFSNLLREVDIIAKYKKDSMFAIIFPGQSNVEGEIVISRLTEEINKYQLKPFDNRDELLSLRTGLSTMQMSEGSFKSLIESAEERLAYGGRKETDVFSDLELLVKSSPDGDQASAADEPVVPSV